MKLVRTIIGLLAIAAAPAAAQEQGEEAREAPPQQEMTFSTIVATYGIWWVKAEGRITADTPRRFEQFMAEQDAIESLQGVQFNSGGGSLQAGMDLGRAIRRMRIATEVDREDLCLSACAYAFLGGRIRNLPVGIYEDLGTTQDRLGFHSFNYDGGRITGLNPGQRDVVTGMITADVQGMTSELSDYVASMGVSTAVVVRSAAVPTSDFRFFTPQELEDLRVLTPRGTDISEFRLVPDGDTLLALASHEDHQFIIACRATPSSNVRKPVFVYTQAVAATPGELPEELPEPIRLSRILQLPPLPWTQEDVAHGHFHAGRWLNPVDFPQVFSHFNLGITNEQDENLDPEQLGLSAATAQFRTEPEFFHGLVELPVAMARQIAGATKFELWFSQRMGPESDEYRWGHRFESKSLERDIIRAALAPCI